MKHIWNPPQELRRSSHVNRILPGGLSVYKRSRSHSHDYRRLFKLTFVIDRLDYRQAQENAHLKSDERNASRRDCCNPHAPAETV